MSADGDRGSDFGIAWRADVYRIEGAASRGALARLLLRHRTFRPVFTARLCRASRAWPRSTAPVAAVVRQIHRWAQQQAGIDFPSEATVGPGLTIVHGWGTVVSPDARIGTNVTLFHGVTLGRRDRVGPDGERTVGGAPRIGDRVWIGPGAIVVGPVTIGDGAIVGGGAVVTKDVEAGSIVTGNPGRSSPGDGRVDCPNPAPLTELERARRRRR